MKVGSFRRGSLRKATWDDIGPASDNQRVWKWEDSSGWFVIRRKKDKPTTNPTSDEIAFAKSRMSKKPEDKDKAEQKKKEDETQKQPTQQEQKTEQKPVQEEQKPEQQPKKEEPKKETEKTPEEIHHEKIKEKTSEIVKNNEDMLHSYMHVSNDYKNVTLEAMKKNISNNLGVYEDATIDEFGNSSTEPVNKQNADSFIKAAKKNGHSVIEKYNAAMSSISKPILEKHLDGMLNAVKEAVDDGSLGDVSQKDLDELVRDDMKRLLHQEVETRGRSLGDHGIRHCSVNGINTDLLLSTLQKNGIKITGRQKLMGWTIQASHDIGYTLGDAATDITKGGLHKSFSAKVAEEGRSKYEKIFGKDDTDRIIYAIGTHDDPVFEWKNDPLTASVRLADNVALFGKEKVQDLFIRSPKAMKLACKLRMAAEAGDEGLQKTVKENMHKHIDESDEFDAVDKPLLHHQVDEMSEGKFSTSMDILARFSGKVEGFRYDKDSDVMNVDMKYSPEGETVDSLFGDEVASSGFKKFIKDMSEMEFEKKSPEQQEFLSKQQEMLNGKRGSTLLADKKGKAVLQINIDGIDDEPINSATTSEMKDMVRKTARFDFRRAITSISPPPEKASPDDMQKCFSVLNSAKDKFNTKEWERVMDIFKSNKDNSKAIVDGIKKFGLLDSEKDYLRTKEAKVVAAIVRRLMMQQRELIADKVFEKIVSKKK